MTAKHFIIATGSRVAPSPLPQLNSVGYITSDEALALRRLPKSLIVLGGGPIACEFAQFFARFGVKVTLIQRSGHMLREFDTDAGMELEKVFRREGVRVFTGTRLIDARRKGKLKTVAFEHAATEPFPSPPRKSCSRWAACPTRQSLGLAKAGVATEQWTHCGQ